MCEITLEILLIEKLFQRVPHLFQSVLNNIRAQDPAHSSTSPNIYI